MIGTFGPIVFFASDQTIKTFESLKRTDKGRWTKHDIVLRKPVSEFLGPDLDTISFKMHFDAFYGLNPRKEMDALSTMVRDGKCYPLVIGGKSLGARKWSLKNVSHNWKHVDNRGNVLVSEVTVDLEEYV